jgi:pimeloyl-ACP methyl ester carboxylesterase
MLGADTVLIGHSMGCNVVQQYLEKHRARAAVLMAPSTPRGIRRITLRDLYSRNADGLHWPQDSDPCRACLASNAVDESFWATVKVEFYDRHL